MLAVRGSLMAAGARAGENNLGGLRLDLLRQAADIYLAHAYAGRSIPESVSRRLVWPGDRAAEDLLASAPFERAGTAPGRSAAIYALRLGNGRYPHMKLQIQPWPNGAGFMLSVNTHDQVSGIELGGEAEAFRALQTENQRLKELIEQAWDDAGLPTFLRYLRDYISSRGDGSHATLSDGPNDGAAPAADAQTPV